MTVQAPDSAVAYQPDAHPPPRRLLSPDTPVEQIPGIFPEQAAALVEGLSVHTLYDLLLMLPQRHEDQRDLVRIAGLRPGMDATLRVRVRSCRLTRTLRRRRQVVEIVFEDATGVLQLTSFNLHHATLLQGPRGGMAGTEVLLTGRVEMGHGSLTLANYEFELLKPGQEVPAFRPVYRGCAGLTPRQVARLMARIVPRYAHCIPDPLPDYLEHKHNYPTLAEALRTVHTPPRELSLEALQRAQERLAFTELFLLEVAVMMRRETYAYASLPPICPVSEAVHERILARLPFVPTGDQQRAFAELRADFAASGRMLRLLQGDVGTGKTAVAVYGMLAAVAAGHQAALLAPTEILAQQHAALLRTWLGDSRVRLALLTGSVTGAKRREVLAALRDGRVDLVVGTHALLEPAVQFASLGLVVVDEQHKFGVLQRQALVDKGAAPHLLVMTATPIPRTLALSAYGDLDCTVLRERPPGRRPVRTFVVLTEPNGMMSEKEENAWRLVRDRLAVGEQVYVVCPAVQEIAGRDTANVTRTAAEVREPARVGPDVPIGVLHGGLSAEAKQQAMDAFVRGETRLLVASTVVEVGVDVPNATVMVILQAETLGLSQLHQLRGRIGRGQVSDGTGTGTGEEPVCLLIAAPPATEEARERLRTIRATDDGFEIAETDLALRGAGEVFGTRQSGLPRLRVADLRAQGRLVETARDDAKAALAGERLSREQLDEYLRRHFGPDMAIVGESSG